MANVIDQPMRLAAIALLLAGVWFGPAKVPAQAAPPVTPTPPVVSDDLARQNNLDPDAPGRFFHILAPDEKTGKREARAMKVILEGIALSGVKDGEAANVLLARPPRWPRTGSVRRYNHDGYEKVIRRFRGAGMEKTMPMLVFRRLDCGKEEARKEFSVAFADITFLRFPQTWENIWERWVLTAPVADRLERVIAFDEKFREQIENVAAQPEWFSPEEQAAYARFYQDQYAFSRDRNPGDAKTYWRLAAFHESRGNVDAQISVYLDAIRNEIPQDERTEFHYRVGETLVRRLGLYEDAIPHLDAARIWADARLLHVEALHMLKRHDEAQTMVDELDRAIASDTTLMLKAPVDDIRGRALLLKARSLLYRHKMKSAYDVFQTLPDLPSIRNEATYLLASMLLYSGKANEAAREIEKNKTFGGLLAKARLPKPDLSALPYDSLGCEALSVWAGARAEQGGEAEQPEIFAALDYAAALDPISIEPALARGKAHEVLGRFPQAFAAYRAGAAIQPDEPRLNYAIASLYQRSGNTAMARTVFNAVLHTAPDYYPAMNRLGELCLDVADQRRDAAAAIDLTKARTEEERIQLELQVQTALGEVADALRNAAAYFSTSLDVNPDQIAVAVRLAGLYVRLCELERDPDLVLNYLSTARDRARQGMNAVERFGERKKGAAKPSKAEIASAPPLEAFTICAYACYELGKRVKDRDAERSRDMLESARDALERYLYVAQHPDYFPTPQDRAAYRDSASFKWADKTLNDILANERQYRKRDSFKEFAARTLASGSTLGGRWGLMPGDKPDPGFLRGTKVDGGRLVVGIDNQETAGYVSRISLQEKFSTLARVTTVISDLGEAGISRGIHMTCAKPDDSGRGSIASWSILLGFDSDNALFYDVRAIRADLEEGSLLPEGRVTYINVRQYGGMRLGVGDRVQLGLLRVVPDENGSSVEYYALVNGYRVRLDLSAIGEEQREVIDNANFIEDEEDAVMRIGFFAFGRKGVSGALPVEECEWVLDSNLARRKQK